MKITAAFCGLVLSGLMLISATTPAYAAFLANAPSSPVIAKTVSNGAGVSPASASEGFPSSPSGLLTGPPSSPLPPAGPPMEVSEVAGWRHRTL